MKTFLKWLISIMFVATGITVSVIYSTSENLIHPRRDALLTIICMVVCFAAGYFVLDFAPIGSRVFAIYTCIKAKKYIKQKPVTLYNATGCHTYRELYKYASQELYYTR